jgi:hypothetical protein
MLFDLVHWDAFSDRSADDWADELRAFAAMLAAERASLMLVYRTPAFAVGDARFLNTSHWLPTGMADLLESIALRELRAALGARLRILDVRAMDRAAARDAPPEHDCASRHRTSEDEEMAAQLFVNGLCNLAGQTAGNAP